MARITLEAVTKDVKNSKTGELVYVQGQTRIRIFDEEQSDGITLEGFEAIVSQQGNFILINQGFTGERGNQVPAREAKYTSGQIHIRKDGASKIYEVPDNVIQAFAIVAGQTRVNNRELELRRQKTAA